MAKERLDIAAAVEYVQNHGILSVDAIDDDVIPDGEASQVWRQIMVSATAHTRTAPQRGEQSVMASTTLSAISMLLLCLAM